MCECGCAMVTYDRKIIDKEGHAWLFGIYASCQNCCNPVGIDVFRCPPEDFDDFEVNSIPEFEVGEFGRVAGMVVISTEAVRSAMRKVILGHKPEGGVIDEVDADCLVEEAFPDLRDAVFETMDA